MVLTFESNRVLRRTDGLFALLVLNRYPVCVCVVCVCVCVVISFILDVRLVDVPAGVAQE